MKREEESMNLLRGLALLFIIGLVIALVSLPAHAQRSEVDNIDILADKELTLDKEEESMNSLESLEEVDLDRLVEKEERKIKQEILRKEDIKVTKTVEGPSVTEKELIHASETLMKEDKPKKDKSKESENKAKEETQQTKKSYGPKAIALVEHVKGTNKKLISELSSAEVNSAKVDEEVEEVLDQLSRLETRKVALAPLKKIKKTIKKTPKKIANKKNLYSQEDKIIELVPTF